MRARLLVVAMFPSLSFSFGARAQFPAPGVTPPSCDSKSFIRKGTTFGLPSENATPTQFRKALQMEGVGLDRSGKIVIQGGGTIPSCDAGSSKSFAGTSGNCQIPYFSVGADTKIYPYGTILEIQSLAGKKVKVDGREFTHPGYVIVDGDGTAPGPFPGKKIEGLGRFDFFVGGNYTEEKVLDLRNFDKCRVGYRAIRPADEDYKKALKTIEDTSGAKIKIQRQQRAENASETAT